jgi:hypothetical protein
MEKKPMIEVQRGLFVEHDEVRELVRDLRQCVHETAAIEMLTQQLAEWIEANIRGEAAGGPMRQPANDRE